jgi:hypothetical protein
LGFDSAEVRKERSVLRHAALCMALATWIEVWAYRCAPKLAAASFSRKLAALREHTVMEMVFASGPRTQGSRQIARSLGTLLQPHENPRKASTERTLSVDRLDRHGYQNPGTNNLTSSAFRFLVMLYVPS